MKALHRHRKIFMFLNGVLIVGFSSTALLAPNYFWPFLGFSVGSLYLDRALAWYLLTFGIGGILVAPAPERQPLVVGLLGLEKAGAVIVFTIHLVKVQFNFPLAMVAALDGVLTIILISYSLWLVRQPRHDRGQGQSS